MQRRNFLIGAASTAIGGSALVGSGAFTSVEAERDVTVEVGGDNDAYLGLEAVRTDIISDDGASGQLSIDLGSQATSKGGEGFNDDAVTEIEGVFRITNQGTNDVAAGFSQDPNQALPFVGVKATAEPIDGVELEVQNAESFDESATDSQGAVLTPGDSTLVDVTVDTLDEDPEQGSGQVVIGAFVEDF